MKLRQSNKCSTSGHQNWCILCRLDENAVALNLRSAAGILKGIERNTGIPTVYSQGRIL